MAVLYGHVYCLYVPIARKDKLIVPAYVQEDQKVRFFIINSERTQYQINNQNIVNHILMLRQATNPTFLDYDSWLCCDEVIGGLTVEDIESNPNSYRCALDAQTTSQVRVLIGQSNLYSRIQLSYILQHWPVTEV